MIVGRIFHQSDILPIPSMGLVYLPLHLIDVYGKCNVYIYRYINIKIYVCQCIYIYTSPMDAMGESKNFMGVRVESTHKSNSSIPWIYTPRMQSWQIEVYLPEE